jgi:hypothetical protein
MFVNQSVFSILWIYHKIFFYEKRLAKPERMDIII